MHIGSLNSSRNTHSINFYQKNQEDKNSQGTSGSGNSIIDQLQKQKEELTKRKSDIMSNAADKGNYSEVKDNIKQIDEQIKDVEKQIGNIQAQQNKDKLNSTDKKDDNSSAKGNNNGKISSASEVQGSTFTAESMGNLLQVYGDIKTSINLFSQRQKMDGKIKTLNSDIEQDKKLGQDSRMDMGELSGAKDGIRKLDGEIAKKMKNYNEHTQQAASESTNVKNYYNDNGITEGQALDYTA